MQTQIVLLLLAIIAPAEQAKQNENYCMALALEYHKKFPNGDLPKLYLLCTLRQLDGKGTQS